MKPATKIILLALLILIGAYPLGARSSWAFNFTVNSFDDAGDANPGNTSCETAPGNGVCTLRAAIQEANSFPIQHNIALPAGTYILSLGELLVKENITINGTINQAGQAITFIDGNNASRIFKVAEGTPLTLNSLKLQNGAHTADGPKSGGGAIYNQGTVNALNVTLTGNQGKDAGGNVSYGGGIFNGGSLTLNYCTLIGNQAGNGGGLYNNGTATIKNLTFKDNIAGSGSGIGGGIYNSGTLTLEKTTVNGSAAGTGGGFYNDGIMELTNNTLNGNIATGSGGGIYNGSITAAGVVAQATLTNVTLSNNSAANGGGGGIFNKTDNTIYIKNTIIAYSTGGNCAGGEALNSFGYNLDDELYSACGLPQANDLYPQNPNLGGLQDNGGPTFTQVLGLALAKNVGTGCPTTDQRGYPRLLNSCDVGAFEDTTDNPVPAITTLFPNSKQAGDPAFKLTVNGYTYGTFGAGSVIHWNGNPKTTTFVNTSQLTADIPASDLAVAGTAKVTVVNPGSGGGVSNEVVFTVTRTNPVPTITSINPAARPAGGPDFTLLVDGSNFVDQSSVVRWNGIARPTTFISDSQLIVDIPAADLAVMGTASVTVSNSPPGGGISDPPAAFTIGPPILYLPIIMRN